jgi:hypothetical protein
LIGGFTVSGDRHSGTTALHSVLKNAGHDVTGEFLLGMVGGLGFTYRCAKMMSAPFVGCRD